MVAKDGTVGIYRVQIARYSYFLLARDCSYFARRFDESIGLRASCKSQLGKSTNSSTAVFAMATPYDDVVFHTSFISVVLSFDGEIKSTFILYRLTQCLYSCNGITLKIQYCTFVTRIIVFFARTQHGPVVIRGK
jgi:hypothetical protein